MNRTKCLLLAGYCLVMSFVGAPDAGAQITAPRVGVFFDTEGNSCSAPLEPFGDPVQAHILAFVEPGVEVSGGFFRLQLPLDINIDSISWPKNSNQRGSITSTTGVELIFQVCPITTTQPLLLATLMLADVSFGEIRSDLQIDVTGGTITAPDTLDLLEPNLKVCDPEDPEGYSDLIVAPSTLATFNCSSGSCPCEETSVTPTTWTAVRKLYADD